jgi:hypothetical protein
MKKIYSVLLAVTVLVFTPYAQAMTCYGGVYCIFTDTNPGFENATPGQYWSYDTGVTFPTESTCYLNNHVANLDNGEDIWRFPFVNGTFTSFKLQFKAFLPGDTNNFYDELKVTVRNRDTGVEEVMYLHGNSYDGSNCSFNNFYLSNDYSNANTMVLFEAGGLSSHAWQIDDVSFIGYY